VKGKGESRKAQSRGIENHSGRINKKSKDFNCYGYGKLRNYDACCWHHAQSVKTSFEFNAAQAVTEEA